ncbi:tetratricopeptide repeat protein, partial [Streptomyces erythrochromogenes]
MYNTFTGGAVHVVFQGRDFQDVTVQLPPKITPALSGLPGASRTFTGRDETLDRMLEALAPDGTGRQRAELVTVVAGLAGIGKTELVVQTAVRARNNPGWFPGGVLFVDLFGYDPDRRLSPEQALDGWLRALGIPGEHIPDGLQELQRLYRSVLAAYAEQGRRILVIIDNASTEEQARPLLPTDGTTAALVTSRHTLDGLEDARLTDLDVLDDHASATLLDQALRRARGDSDTRMADDPDAAAAIARLCAGLPLALRIAAAILAAAPTRPAPSLATALKAEHTRLNKLRRPDRAVRAAFDLSYQLLDDEPARLFRLLPLNPGPDLSTEAAAHLADSDPDTTEELLQHLADAHLVEYGHVWGRWRLHDLVRLFADEHGHTQAAVDQRQTARARLFTHYQDTTAAANTHMNTGPGTPSLRFDDRSTSLAWLDAEHTNLITTATTAPALGHPQTATALTLDLARYLRFRRRFHDWSTITTVALTVLRELGDRHSEGIVLNNLGLALREVRRFEEAIDVHTQVLDIYRELGDRHSEGGALNNLGLALREVRRFEEAIDAHTQGLD